MTPSAGTDDNRYELTASEMLTVLAGQASEASVRRVLGVLKFAANSQVVGQLDPQPSDTVLTLDSAHSYTRAHVEHMLASHNNHAENLAEGSAK